jgi:predicted ribosome quality control (RQC) complex YloA/Tae2 family protein
MNIANKAFLLLVASSHKTATETMGAVARSISRQCPRQSAAFANYISSDRFMHLMAGQISSRAFAEEKPHNYAVQEPVHSHRRFSTNLLMTSNPNDDETPINIPQMKKEITRLSLRTHKKIGKVSIRIQAANDQLQKLRAAIDSSNDVGDALMKQMEQSPSEATMNEYQSDLAELQSRLRQLNWLEEQFNNPPLKKKSSLSPAELLQLTESGEQILQYITELEINDDEEAKAKRIEEDLRNKRSKKQAVVQRQQNEQKEGGRLPYRRYYTQSNVEIRVGKQSTDNDVLSLSPEHRSGSHWWYHASGCPGSHVVLCTDVSSPSEEDVKDAASLAALKSKCIGQSVIKVSMTRARNVSKPPGAKAGLVQLNGDVKTIVLRKDEVERRCERLEKTVMINK